MINIIKQEVIIEKSLKKKLELICEFSNKTKFELNGAIKLETYQVNYHLAKKKENSRLITAIGLATGTINGLCNWIFELCVDGYIPKEKLEEGQ